ncbi:unnamed protein product [Pleuronectes platessa]|uniref:Uncharacterized protein n=1 Tax=Pleuronectes platessa TaxID=8262 RepID=A0A9N7YDG1_PLEPL|nr:unnamed protein product [Pleuronectes platessa]
MDNSDEPEDLLDGKIVFHKNKDRTFSKTKELVNFSWVPYKDPHPPGLKQVKQEGSVEMGLGSVEGVEMTPHQSVEAHQEELGEVVERKQLSLVLICRAGSSWLLVKRSRTS